MPILFFFFNDTATTEIYTLSLHDALPISACLSSAVDDKKQRVSHRSLMRASPSFRLHFCPLPFASCLRSEEHTSELQSRSDLVCRLLLEKKKRIRVVVCCRAS